MPRKITLVALIVATGLIGAFGFAAPANAASISTGCSTTDPAPHKSGSSVLTTDHITCSNANITGDGLFVELWRNNGNGTYNHYSVTEGAKGTNFTSQTITSTHTCSGTKSYVWHAELYGDIQYTSGDVNIAPVNSADVTLACG